MDRLGDEELAERFADSGDARCFDALVERYIRRVRAMIYPMVLNHADADDLTQEVFLKVYRGLPGYRRRSRFSTWLYRIAMNTVNSFYRSRRVRPETSLASVPEQVTSTDPLAELAADELDARLADALAALSPRLRAAITLTVINELSAAEAARVERCTRATIYWRIHEARKQLLSWLNNTEEV